MKNNKGFSLVELIVVIAIMAILAAVAIPTFATFIEKANVASDEQFIADVQYAVELANTKFGKTVSAVDVNATNGDLNSVVYTIDGVEVTISINAENKATATAAANADAKTQEYYAVAQDVIDTIDWTYAFKSKDYVTGTPDAATPTT